MQWLANGRIRFSKFNVVMTWKPPPGHRAFDSAADYDGRFEDSMGTIDEILNEDVEGEAAPVVEETPAPVEQQPEPQADTVRDDKGRFASKGVDDGAPPAPDKLPQDEFKALKEERTKRQELERRLAEIEAARQQQPAPDLWDDTQGWQQHFGTQVVSQAVQQASLNAKLDMSEMMVRQANPDFEEMKSAFLALAEENPGLVKQALSDPHPWQKAYSIAKIHRTMTEVGATDIDTLKAKIREELMAEMGQQPARQQLPPTLTGERTVASRAGPAWAGPQSLEDMLR